MRQLMWWSRRSLLAMGIVTLGVAAGPAMSLAADHKVFTIAYSSSFPDLDPSSSFSNDGAVLSNVYEGLVWFKPNPTGSGGTIEPRLATSWAASDGGKTWTFKLRPGVTFHDGTGFDSAAVKFSVERTRKINAGAAWIWSPVSSIETPDPLTVVFKLSDPAPLDQIAASGFAAWMISPKAADKDAAWFNAGHDAGTGPYLITAHQPGQQTVLKRFDPYWGGWTAAQFTDVVLEVVEEPTLRQQKIESGDADWTMELPTENLPVLQANPDLAVVTNAAFQNLVGQFNVQRKPLDNPKVRQALSYAFPSTDFINAAMSGHATASHGIIPAGMLGFDPTAPQYTYDLGKAKALLAEAGLPAGGFKMTMTYTTGDTVEETGGQLWKAALAKLGVDLTLQPMSWEAQWALAKSDPAKAQDVMVMYWWPTFVTPYDFLFNLFHSEAQPNYNLGYYRNKTFDDLIDSANAQSATDRDAALAKFRQAQRMLIDDAAALFMLDEQGVHVIRKDIKGYVDNPAYAHVVFVKDLSR